MSRKRFTRDRRPPVMESRDSSTFGSLVRNRITPGAEGKLTNPFKQHPYVGGALRLMGQMLGGVPFRVVRPDPKATVVRERLGEPIGLEAREQNEQALSFMRQNSPIRYRDIGEKGSRSTEEPVVHVPNSPFQEAFDAPSTRFARSELWTGTIVWLMTDGNCVWHLERTSASAPPSRITPMSRAGWEPVLDEEGEIVQWMRSVKTGDGVKKVPFEPHEIVHFRIFCPESQVWGASPLQAAWSAIEQDVMAGAFNKSFLENGGEPGTVLRLPLEAKVSDEDVRDIVRRWDARHVGAGKANKTAVLVDGMEIDRSASTHHDMQFTELLEKNRDAILAALTLHKAALGVTDALNRATITEARRMVWTNLLGPLASYIEDRLYSSLFKGNTQGDYAMFDMKQVPELQEDLGEKLATAKTMQELHVPLNDITQRLQLDLPEYEWGDEPWITSGLMPISHALDSLNESGQSEGAGEPPNGKSSPDDDAESESKSKASEDDDSSDDDGGRARSSKYRPMGARRDWWRGWWRAVGDRQEREFKSELKSYWYDLRKQQLAAFSSIRAPHRRSGDDLFTEGHIDRILFDSQPWKQRLVTSAERHYESTGRASLKELGKEIELKFDLQDPAWERFLEAKRIKVAGITERAREHIRAKMQEAVREGMTINEAQDLIKRSFNGLAQPSRRLRIARTEIASAANGARFLGMKASGVEQVEWVTSADREVRETHVLYEQQGAVPINTNFLDFSGGVGSLRTPNDPLGPASEVVNCRCTLISVVD